MPALAGFGKVMTDRLQYPVDRVTLHEQVTKAYASVVLSPIQQSNIKSLLLDNTFTVITAHQPSLFGGPMYYIYKICSVINLSQQLNSRYPDTHVVPVFINGSEDHDFDEIDHFNIFGKDIKWEREAEGPVGRLTTKGLQDVLNQTQSILGDSENAVDILNILQKALKTASNYNDFVFRFVNALFAKYGLLVINTDNKVLKSNFRNILRKEIIDRPSQKIVLSTQEELTGKGFKAQAHPRDINLFYLGYGGRQRITFADGKYQIVDTEYSFSELEILEELEKSPENFSPNVVMRPLYQEFTLPNLAYIGGGGEIAYWLERKKQFEEFNVFYPMLIRRNSALLVNKGTQKQTSKLELTTDLLFDRTDSIINAFLLNQVEEDISIEDEKKAIEEAYIIIAEKAKVHDPTLSKSILAEMTKQLKSVDNLGGRIKRVLKSKEETNVNRIKKLKEKLFPGDGLQERHDNFLQYYSDLGPELIEYLITNLDPLDRRFSIIST